MGDVHSFNVDVAKEVGVNAAIILQGIKWWCQKNKANGRHLHEGLFWTYNSTKAMMELYPYLGRSAIDGAIKKLESGGYIRIGNFNKTAYDKTRWFAITLSGLALFDGNPCTKSEMDGTKSEMDCTNAQLRFDENVQPIPVGTSSSNSCIPDALHDEPPYEEIIRHLNDKVHKNFSPMVGSYRESIRARWSEYPDMPHDQRLKMFLDMIDTMVVCWKGTKWEQYLNPSTLFRPTKFDKYVNMTPRKWDEWDSKGGQTKNHQRNIDLSDYGKKTGTYVVRDGKRYVYVDEERLEEVSDDTDGEVMWYDGI